MSGSKRSTTRLSSLLQPSEAAKHRGDGRCSSASVTRQARSGGGSLGSFDHQSTLAGVRAHGVQSHLAAVMMLGAARGLPVPVFHDSDCAHCIASATPSATASKVVSIDLPHSAHRRGCNKHYRAFERSLPKVDSAPNRCRLSDVCQRDSGLPGRDSWVAVC